jgi:4-amino-4-deoxy-L-arabinose transferase-like glycosyltransferase
MRKPAVNPARDKNLFRHRLLACLLVCGFFVALAPTLGWQEFSSGPENLIIATAMEMRRGGPWLVPTLQGEARVAKPPLAAWTTALSIRPFTMREIDTLDHNSRERGFFFLAFESRWPALVCACLLLLGVFELGTIIGDSRLGLMSIAICASTYFILRFARYTTTDIQLALWVTWANVFLALAVVRGRWWTGCIGAAMALGLAMLSKGPVALVQSVVPMAIYALTIRRFSPGRPRRGVLPAIIVSSVIFAAMALWWFTLVFITQKNVLGRWFSEVTRIGATDTPSSPLLAYLAIVGYVLPWTLFLIVGAIAILKQLRRRQVTADALGLFLLVIPLLIMTLAKDRQDRYTLPMIPAAAIVAAIGVRDHLSRWKSSDAMHRLITWLHWIMLGAIAVALPLAGAIGLLKQVDGTPWFAWRFALIEAALGAALLVAGIVLYRRRPGALVAMTFATMLVMQAVLFKGYCSSSAGRSDLKPLADVLAARYPDATFYNAHPRGKRPPTDLGVYLNRTIRWIPDTGSLQPGVHPIVVFMLQDKGEPDPISPPGFHFIERAKRDKDYWWAFVLPPG